MSMEGQYEAFRELRNVVGMLACLRILADLGVVSNEPYLNLLEGVRRKSPADEVSRLEQALVSSPDEVRRAALQGVLGDSPPEGTPDPHDATT